ncbi:hypothetical protein HMI54_014130 [Coelomomyces lativittatus]|nr:hypothetical protein HMI56_001203 [Coelomomyces lativittatus]KAJ1518173.1 hypothetical protein HMI55_002058 [Coelomomyces lativittatus]KAJ1518627.1 hypothetical protein HMI54_014130 [Coelomomyces lativittatus]
MEIEDLPHCFTKNDQIKFRQLLLAWYQKNKRDLPWRKNGSFSKTNQTIPQSTHLSPSTYLSEKKVYSHSVNETENSSKAPSTNKRRCIEVDEQQQRGYEVWVSEIMLQQTQVATVIEYYKRWMKQFPTIQDLANADLEKVNQAWAGLGYYSRAKRLHEGAKYICTTLNHQMPTTAKALEKLIPGIGPYTSGAIASIAFNECSPVVDGNVIRVLSRLRAIGGNPKSSIVIQLFWKLANDLITGETQPGDFNQALMELGALVCTPMTPKCETCPVEEYCQVSPIHQRRPSQSSCQCEACATWTEPVDSNTVLDFPRKPKKKTPKEITLHVLLLHHEKNFLLQQRGKDVGWLAGLWEFPNFESKSQLMTFIQNVVKKKKEKRRDINTTKEHDDEKDEDEFSPKQLGKYVHMFSHLKLHVTVNYLNSPDLPTCPSIDPSATQLQKYQWVHEDKIQLEAISKGMLKAIEFFHKQKIWLQPAIQKKKLDLKNEDSQPEVTRVLRSKKINENEMQKEKEG